MKQLLVLVILFFYQPLFSMEKEMSFPLRIYTPHIVVDNVNHGAKGAVQLLWQKSGDENSQYVVEVSNGVTTYSNVESRNFHHVMIFFEKDYYWRVRQADSVKQTSFSPWRPLKVIRGGGLPMERQLSSQKKSSPKETDHYLLDVGE